MSHRIVEVSRPSALSSKKRQLIITQEGTEVGRVPVEDMALLILDSWGIVQTIELAQLLAAHNVAVVTCDERHMPLTLTLRLEGHHLHAAVLRQQLAAAQPTKKRLWQSIIKGKIHNQAECLRRAGAATPKKITNLDTMAFAGAERRSR